jgi:hypothetical protein
MAVQDVVLVVPAVDLDGRKRLSLTKRENDRLEPRAAALVGGKEVAVELAVGAVGGTDDVADEDLKFLQSGR